MRNILIRSVRVRKSIFTTSDWQKPNFKANCLNLRSKEDLNVNLKEALFWHLITRPVCPLPQVAAVSLLKMDNAYKIPHLRCWAYACKTNLPSNTAFRGFGFPQSALVTETWITGVADKTGLSPEKVRKWRHLLSWN